MAFFTCQLGTTEIGGWDTYEADNVAMAAARCAFEVGGIGQHVVYVIVGPWRHPNNSPRAVVGINVHILSDDGRA